MLECEVSDILLPDVTRLSLGIGTKGGIFTTANENQPSVRLQLR